jgi:hypothetical protein
VKDVLDRFIAVRLVQANALDLALFQFDTGLTWAVFFLNADRTLYGRYGSRGQADGSEDVSVEGFRKAAEAALELHRGYPGNRAALAGKSGPAPRFATPREYPALRDFPAAVDPAKGERRNPTCVHCHNVQQAEYRFFRDQKKPIPDEVLWSWPMPDALGLSFDVKERATVKSATGSSAKDGFRAGDEFLTLEGQPLISIADVQWVLERATSASVRAEIRRDGKTEALALTLPAGWRRAGDFSWRDATWGAFRPDMNGVSADGGIKITHAGPDLLAAGFKRDDVIVEVDGRRFENFSRFLAYLAQERKAGEKLNVTIIRKGEELKLPMTTP